MGGSSQVQTRQRSFPSPSPSLDPPVAARGTFRTPSAGPGMVLLCWPDRHGPCPVGSARPGLSLSPAQQLLPGRRDPTAPRARLWLPRLRHQSPLPPPPPRPPLTSQPGVRSLSLPSAPPGSGRTSGDPQRPRPGPSLPRGARPPCPRSGADAARPSRRCQRTPGPRPRPAAAPARLPRGSPCRGLHLPGASPAGVSRRRRHRPSAASLPPMPPRRCGGAAHAPPARRMEPPQGRGGARRSRAVPRGQRRTRHRDLPGTLPGSGEPEPIPGLRGPGGKCTAASRPPAVSGERPALPPLREARPAAPRGPARPRLPRHGAASGAAGGTRHRPGAAARSRGRRAEPAAGRVGRGDIPGRRYLRCPGGRGAPCHRAAAMALLGRERLRPARMDRTT